VSLFEVDHHPIDDVLDDHQSRWTFEGYQLELVA